MRYRHALILILVVFMQSAGPSSAALETADDLLNPREVQDLHLFINSRDLRLLHERFQDNTYYPADLLWRGTRVRNIAVRSRGFGSRNGTKVGIAIDVDRYTTGQRFLGLQSLVLDNLWQDPAMIREYLAMGFLDHMGQPAPREAFCRLYINGAYQGLYALVEPIDAAFVARTLGVADGTLFEFHWVFPFFGQDLESIDRYKPLFEPRTHEDDADSVLWGPIRDLWAMVNDSDDAAWRQLAEPLVDLDQFITQAAIENYVAENDGLLGYAGMDNFYLYR
jgi:spore coat protein CotH